MSLVLVGAAAGAFLTGKVVVGSPTVEAPTATTVTARVTDDVQVESMTLDLALEPRWQVALAPVEGAVLTDVDIETGRPVKSCTRLGTINDQPVTVLPGETQLYRDLAKGDRGADVARLQEALAWCGYPSGDAAGSFGSSTQASVESLTGARSVIANHVVWLPADADEIVVASWGGAVGDVLDSQAAPLELESTEVQAVARLDDPGEKRIVVGDDVTVTDAKGKTGTTEVISVARSVEDAASADDTDVRIPESESSSTGRRIVLRAGKVKRPISATWEFARSPEGSLSVPLAAINGCGGTGSCITIVNGGERHNVPVKVLVVGETGVSVEPASPQDHLEVGDSLLLGVP